MASRFGNDEEEDDVLVPKEPQVNSLDPAERKAARALRIKRRQEAIKKAELPPEEVVADEEPGQIELATAAAAEELQRMNLDGAAKVTNIKVTTDEREVIRRTQFFKDIEDSIKRMEEEAAEAQLQYDAISDNWEKMLALRDPLEIDYEMKEQKAKCDRLLSQKDVSIAKLKQNLKDMDEAYFLDLQNQDNDIKELSERIEKQLTIMQRAYDKQLGLIEEAIGFERDAMIEHNNKRWEALYKQRNKEELAHMDERYEQLEEFKLDVEAIMWDHHDKYREAKIKLESLIQELQLELEKLKATCIINTEKIGYTYQVLRKREEENVFVRSQQKRKLNKMSDVTNTLRAKIRKAAEDGALEEIKADNEIIKLMQVMDDLEKKSDQFSFVNHNRFSQIWRMSAAKCLEMSKQIRQSEVALHAHVLAEPPPPPPPPPPKSPLSKYEHETADKITEEHKPPREILDTSECATEAKQKLIRHILKLVADNTGFLVEDRLLKLIEKYQTSSQSLCTLDAIFMALEINSEEDVELLCQTMLNYAFCPVCVGLEMTSDLVGHSTMYSNSQEMIPSNADSQGALRGKNAERLSARCRSSFAGRSFMSSSVSRGHISFRFSHATSDLSAADLALVQEADEIINKCGGDAQVSMAVTPTDSQTYVKKSGRGVTVVDAPTTTTDNKPKCPYVCPLGHPLEIESMRILTALNEFISVFVPTDKQKLNAILDDLKPPSFETPSRKLTTEEIEQYWTQWKNMFPAEKDRYWDGLLTGLNHYLTILQERERLHDEVVELRRRNAELRRLVRGALPEISAPLPHYLRPAPAFTSAAEDDAPLPYETRLPPI